MSDPYKSSPPRNTEIVVSRQPYETFQERLKGHSDAQANKPMDKKYVDMAVSNESREEQLKGIGYMNEYKHTMESKQGGRRRKTRKPKRKSKKTKKHSRR